ncbi:MAG: ankyrin repeat domain-containing protein, partial [Alphaproteobacteria bacterium]|nr:ankyrin repeat domain-containing protein [Alphaproteobacteria bacterium]
MTTSPDTPLHIAARDGDVAEIKALLAKGHDVNAKGKRGRTPLHAAAFEFHSEAITALLDGGADIEAREEKSAGTPLHVATIGDQSRIKSQSRAITTLVKAGANIEARDKPR